MLDVLLLVLIVAVGLCICIAKCNKNRDDEDAANPDLPAFRETMSERRSRMRRGEEPSAPPASQDPEAQAQYRESQIRSVLFSRKLEAKESVSSLRSILSATKEEMNDTTVRRGSESKKGSFIERSWRAATHSVRALSREECTICLDNYEKGDVVCWSKTDQCDHIFHEGCISAWLKDHDECPLCRTNLFEGVDDDDKVESERNTAMEQANVNEERANSIEEETNESEERANGSAEERNENEERTNTNER